MTDPKTAAPETKGKPPAKSPHTVIRTATTAEGEGVCQTASSCPAGLPAAEAATGALLVNQVMIHGAGKSPGAMSVSAGNAAASILKAPLPEEDWAEIPPGGMPLSGAAGAKIGLATYDHVILKIGAVERTLLGQCPYVTMHDGGFVAAEWASLAPFAIRMGSGPPWADPEGALLKEIGAQSFGYGAIVALGADKKPADGPSGWARGARWQKKRGESIELDLAVLAAGTPPAAGAAKTYLSFHAKGGAVSYREIPEAVPAAGRVAAEVDLKDAIATHADGTRKEIPLLAGTYDLRLERIERRTVKTPSGKTLYVETHAIHAGLGTLDLTD